LPSRRSTGRGSDISGFRFDNDRDTEVDQADRAATLTGSIQGDELLGSFVQADLWALDLAEPAVGAGLRDIPIAGEVLESYRGAYPDYFGDVPGSCPV
jgi:hypothetical protein